MVKSDCLSYLALQLHYSTKFGFIFNSVNCAPWASLVTSASCLDESLLVNRWASQEALTDMTEADKRCELYLQFDIHMCNFRIQLIEALFRALNQEKHDRANLNSRFSKLFR